MNERWAIGAVMVVSALVVDARPQQPVYRSRVDAVTIDAAVTDGRSPVANLTAADFELRDNGVVQSILDFGRERLPLDVTVTIDASGSMTADERAVVQRAMETVSNALGPDDRGSVVTFSQRLTERRPMSAPPLSVDFRGVQTGGSAIADALLLSLVTAPVVERRQFALFLTDGEDNASFFDPTVIGETAKHSAGQVSVVITRDNGRLPGGPMQDLFKLVTQMTGGELLQLGRKDDLGRAFLAALESFRMSYVLRYAPTGVSAAGWHDVTVRLKNKKYTVRARRGYWARPGTN